MKFRRDLLQVSAILTAPRLAVVLLAATSMFALAGCGGGGSPNSTAAAAPPQTGTGQETPHNVDIPSGHKLADWLTNNPDGIINVPAGESLDVGGVRFTCSSNGDDCSVRVTPVEDSIIVTSAGGMAAATLVPPPPLEPTGSGGGEGGQPPTSENILDLSGLLHGLYVADLPVMDENERIVEKQLADGEASVFSINDGGTKDYGRVRFSCRGTDCEVRVLNTGNRFNRFKVTYKGDVTASVYNPQDSMWDAIERGLNLVGDTNICDARDGETCYGSLTPGGDGEFLNGDLFISARYEDNPVQGLVMGEDKSTTVPAIDGFTGRRYVWVPERSRINVQQGKENYRAEAIIYTNKDPLTDKSYLSFGRWMIIHYDSEKTPLWTVDAVAPKTLQTDGPQRGWGSLSGKVSYRGGATGYYALKENTATDSVTRPADAGHFTARATLNANFISSNQLEIDGTIDQFKGDDGQPRNWSIDLVDFYLPAGTRTFTRSGRKRIRAPYADWIVDGFYEPDDTSGKWSAQVWDNGNFVQGTFEAVNLVREGRIVGSYLVEKQ